MNAETSEPHPNMPDARHRPPVAGRHLILLVVASLMVFSAAEAGRSQSGGGHTLYGDFKVEDQQEDELKPLTFDIILYTSGGTLVSRQSITNNGRYRFMGVPSGEYDVVVEVENNEVARIRVSMVSPFKNDFRQDISMAWRANFPGGKAKGRQTVSAADFYQRAPANQSFFDKAQAAMDDKKYDLAVSLLRQLVAADAKDFQAWAELGTAHLLRKELNEAEKAYQRAGEERPTFLLGLLNLGRVLIAQKKFEAAVEPLTKAVGAHPTSAEANHLLGEAYLQIKKGSKAVPYLNEAARLGRAEAHLRLASLYNAAGLKDRAAAEYEQFLAKEPKHPDRERLRRYIEENKRR